MVNVASGLVNNTDYLYTVCEAQNYSDFVEDCTNSVCLTLPHTDGEIIRNKDGDRN
jgi:hypothetical protein